ncbi:ABC transporter [Microdochium trichocladiopsis]|uniref:ABC transporter n=1 Tax=Microdochium trichocladiopsis TaxID=1682393 RepID=A0A9P8Y678_9PEZI|nr:ABC transporter [Microdochium trichocladiopsis]KAH7030673.1 ABC transporter [Microdochium trichocladiopsis]
MALQYIPSCPVGVDDSFGPWAGPVCRGGFDFTLFFEDTILTIPLYCLFLLALPVRVFQLARTDVKVVPSLHKRVKLAAAAALAFVNGYLLILWATLPVDSPIHTSASVPAAVLALVASLGFVGLSLLEHERALRPSFVLTSSLGLSVLLDMARVRTIWLITENAGSTTTIPAIYSLSFGLRVFMAVVETIEKHKIIVPEKHTPTVEDKTSSLSRSVFWWLMPLLRLGYGREIGLDDMYVLEEDLMPEPLSEQLAEAWEKVPNKKAPMALFSTWLKTFIRPVLSPVLFKLMNSAFSYSQPFLVTAGINLAAYPQTQPYNNYGYGLIGAYFLVYVGLAVTNGQYEWRLYRCAAKMKGSIIGVIYQKALRLDVQSSGTSHEAAVTLISTDSHTILHALIQLHEIWAGLFEIVIGVYLLSRQLGVACVMPVAVTFACLILTGSLAMPTGKAQAAWILASQERVTTTAKTLGSIKSLRISGLNERAFQVIRQLRNDELSISQTCRILLAAYLVLLVYVPLWGPALTFAVYAATGSNGGTLTITTAFTAVSLFSLVSRPLVIMIFAIPTFAGGIASFGRIQDFLNREERHDARTHETLNEKGHLRSKPSIVSVASRRTAVSRRSNGSRKSAVETHEQIMLEPLTFQHEQRDTIVSIQGHCRWAEDEKPVIDIPDRLDFQRNALTVILGPVGCGKSTMLKAILGELSLFKGEVRTSYTGVAYCGQSPWLPNETVREIITGSDDGPEGFDAARYDEVVSACALRPDFQMWPQGEFTVVGTKGIAMSGGQKHRIALARALYSREEFFVLDDVFSGLDMTTADTVFHKVFGKEGLLRSSHRTAVLASSDVRRMRHVDQVVILNSKGQVEAKGPPEIFYKTKGVSELLGLAGKTSAGSSTEGDSSERKMLTGPQKQSEPVVLPGAEPELYDKLKDRRFGDSAMYAFYARGIGWVTILTFVMAMAAYAALGTFPSIWLKWWGESNILHPNQDTGKWLGVYIALTVGASLAIILGAWQLLIVVINKSGVYFHDILLNTTSRAPMSFFTKVDSGVTVNRFSQDLQLIDMELPMTGFSVATGLAFAIAELVLIAVSTKYLAACLPIVCILCYGVGHFYLRTSRQVRLLDIEYRAPLASQLLRTLDGLETIRAYRWEDKYEVKNMAFLNDSQRPYYMLMCLQRWLVFSVNLVVAMIALVLIVVVTTLREQIGAGYMGVALSNVLAFSSTIEAAVISWTMLEVCLGAVSRVRLFQDETESEEATANESVVLKKPDDEHWPREGKVVIRDLTAAYNSSGVVLDHVSFTIEAGQRVAICGRTGSGKSSLTMCLLRMLDAKHGSITIDGVNIANVPHDHVRKALAAVPQDAYIFGGTVRLNVDPDNVAASDEEIIEVLRKVRLWGKLQTRGGLDGVIGDDSGLSQGETQLLVFARAMLRRSRILILDEFTSSLNDESSSIVYDVLREWFQGWTIIAIAHELESVLDFDRIAVLDKGQLLEYDEPGVLLQTPGSAFRALYEGGGGGGGETGEKVEDVYFGESGEETGSASEKNAST